MSVSKFFRQLPLLIALLVLAVTQSACSLFRPHSESTQDSSLAQQYTMTGFRYEIPLPGKSGSVMVTETRISTSESGSDEHSLPHGFQLQSFVENLFSRRNKPAQKTSTAVQTASLKVPEAPVLAQPARDETQRKFCARINNRLSSISYQECMVVALNSTGHFSRNGLPILRTEFDQLDGVAPTGRVLLVGGVHGDELSSVSIVFEWMQFLLEHNDGEFVWDIIPVMNPDGHFRNKPTRTNANGVDLNRNMPTSDWQSSALAYWRAKAGSSPRKFPGNSAASEPETRWLMEEIDRFKPDMIITVHAPHNLIDYDAPSRKNAPRRFGQLKGGLLGTYPGSLGNYAGVKRGIPVVTIELPSANTAISVNQAQAMWSDMLEWLEKTIPLENQRFLRNRHYARVNQS